MLWHPAWCSCFTREQLSSRASQRPLGAQATGVQGPSDLQDQLAVSLVTLALPRGKTAGRGSVGSLAPPGAHLSGLVDDVAGPDPVALQVGIEAGVEPRGPQPISGDQALVHHLPAAPGEGTGEEPSLQPEAARSVCGLTSDLNPRGAQQAGVGRWSLFSKVENPEFYVTFPTLDC